MIPVTSFAGKTVAVFGLGGSGLASCHALKAGGAEVIASDDNPSGLAEAARAGFITADLRSVSWANFAALVLTPGVPLTHPAPHWTVLKARGAGVEVIGDIELFCRERRHHAPESHFVAITGTNGKSTTTALIAHMLREAGHNVQIGGNIGTAILSLEPPTSTSIYVIECSSYQIDLAPSLDPSVGVLLNLTPDHLDRHGTMEQYAAVKERLVDGAANAVIGIDDDWCRAIALRRAEKPGTTLAITVAGEPPPDFLYSFFGDGTELVFSTGTTSQSLVGDIAGIGSLRGSHNLQNALAALAVGTLVDPDPPWESHVEHFRTFPGLAHRMEQVGKQAGTLFVNDSKATNADATARALSSFDDIFWIAGGKPKTGGIASLAEFFPRIRKAYLIGEAAQDFAATLTQAEQPVPHEISGTLEVAVAAAARDAAASGVHDPVVLLSPACASFDQYRNFEIRGDKFRDLVLALPGVSRVV